MPETQQKYAGFWIRVLASIIDYLILALVGYLLFGSQVTEVYKYGMTVHYNNWNMLIPIAYFIAFWMWKGATPGKMACRLQIIQTDGKPLSLKTAILRLLGYVVSVIPIFLGFFSIGFDKKKQGFHDKIAHTYVIHKG